MLIERIASKFVNGEISLLKAMKFLNESGYTKQERRRIYNGWLDYIQNYMRR